LGRGIEQSVVRDVVEVVGGREAEATAALDRIVRPRRVGGATRSLLARDPELRGLLGELVESFVVLVPVKRHPRRRIVKMAYDQDIALRLALGQKLGWRKATVILRAPAVGFSAAYHADVQTPTDVEILRAQLIVSPGDERYSKV